MDQKKKNRQAMVREVLNGRFFESEWFQRNRILLLMIFFLLLTNITIRYKSEKVIRELTAMEDSLTELRSSSISIAADVMKLSRQSIIVDKVKKSGLNLESSKVPPRKIYIETK